MTPGPSPLPAIDELVQKGLPALDDWLAAHGDDLIAFRRHLHAHPELSGEEHETTRAVVERLLVAGLRPRTLPAGTGLTCDLPAAVEGPRIALRADLDALAMDDGKQVPYRSTRPGVAHACGHDVHTTVVLGAALALYELFGRSGPGLPVRLVFQPAEEQLPGGAVEVIAAGGLDGVEEIYGVHCDPRLVAGQVGLVAGPITSAISSVHVRLTGPGGHTARPERTVDLVRLAGQVAVELPARVSALLDGRPAHLTFGAVHAGDAPNVIPSVADLHGSARTPEVAVWTGMEGALRAALTDLVAGHPGAGYELTYTHGHPPVVNDPRATAHMVDATRALLGDEAVRPTHQSIGGDDFSWYLDHVPGCYARLGVADRATGAAPADLHAHEFDVDEECIATGIRLLVGTVLTSLGRRAPGPARPT